MRSFYAGLDVSDKSTHLCLVDEEGCEVWSGACATDPQVLADTLARRCRGALARVVLETGPLSAFLYHGLVERGVTAICICARHASGVLSARPNKSDRNDAEGLAQLARTGWFKAVHVKDDESHLDRARLKVREQLVKARRSMQNQLRGLLKLFGLKLGAAHTSAKRAERLHGLFAQKPELEPILAPLAAAIEMLEGEIVATTRAIRKRSALDPVCALLTSVPGVGPWVALTYKCSIEDPHRFATSAGVGAYAGLVPRRRQSGERDIKGRITKAGDAMLRHALYEAANSLLGRVKRDCRLRQWGLALAASKGKKRARVAVARKLAALLHTLWRSDTPFSWA